MGAVADNINTTSGRSGVDVNSLDVDLGVFRVPGDGLSIPPAVIIAGLVIAAGVLFYRRSR